jgi:hypothetical protein
VISHRLRYIASLVCCQYNYLKDFEIKYLCMMNVFCRLLLKTITVVTRLFHSTIYQQEYVQTFASEYS